MSPPHLRPEDAEQYILGALEPRAAEALEQHTLVCTPCALLLQREALLDEQLREVARDTPAPQATVLRPARWRDTRTAATVAGMMAAAAALVLVVLRPGPHGVPQRPLTEDFPVLALPVELPEEPQRLVACPDPTSQELCAEEALARGLLVQYPQGVGEVPRYEGHAGLPRTLAPGPSLL